MNVLTRKLEAFAPLSEADKQLIEQMAVRSRRFEARTDLIREGEAPSDVRLILNGFACRYKIISDGKRHSRQRLALRQR